MSFACDAQALERLAALPSVRRAAQEGVELIRLWPLGDAMRMDNDAKYNENLQVRTTLAFARTLTGMDVTMPDAEYVYEGADAIPGRPQRIVDALLAADEAYEIVGRCAVSRDVDLIVQAAGALGVEWSDGVADAIRATVADIEAQIASGAIGGMADESDGGDALAKRFAVALSACDALMTSIEDGGGSSVDVLPVLLYVNELREECAVPRICLTDDDIARLFDARRQADDTLAATAEVVAPLAADEWARHREDVLWDPKEAKERAKREDERRNKEELSAKFAHIAD